MTSKNLTSKNSTSNNSISKSKSDNTATASTTASTKTEAILRDEYLDLINCQLPALAKQESMPVRFNHCFARIVLDNLFEDCWYNCLSRKQPAYKQLDARQLSEAIAIAQSMLKDPSIAKTLNNNSLRWRGKNTR